MTALRRMKVKALNGVSGALLLALGTSAVAQNSDAPVDVTAAPPPSAETVGPSQLKNFNLQGRVTRPSDRPAATTPLPAASEPLQNRPAAATRAEPATVAVNGGPAPRASTVRPSTITSARPSDDSPSMPANAEAITPSLPLEVTTNAAPQPDADDDGLATAVSLDASGSFPSWPWLAALIALVGGGAFIFWSRRGRRQRHGDPGRMAFAGLVPEIAPEAEPLPPARPKSDPLPPRSQPAPTPRPDPTPPPAARPLPPRPAGDGTIVATRLKPQLNVEFQPDRAILTDQDVVLQFEIVLANVGSAPARDVLVEARMFTAHAGQEEEIAAFFRNPMTDGDRMTAIAPLGRISLKSSARLPLDQLHSFEAAGRKLFVPMVGFNILYRSGSDEGQASASYLVGRGGEDDAKLAPFRLDLGPRIFRGLSTRPHSFGM